MGEDLLDTHAELENLAIRLVAGLKREFERARLVYVQPGAGDEDLPAVGGVDGFLVLDEADGDGGGGRGGGGGHLDVRGGVCNIFKIIYLDSILDIYINLKILKK